MAFRGRGRGRGGFGGGGFSFGKQEPFILFPEIELPGNKDVEELKSWIRWNHNLTKWWRASSYYLEETDANDDKSADIERFSDKLKPKKRNERGPVDEYLQLGCRNFPDELIEGLKRARKPKKVRWNRGSGIEKLDMFEKLEEKLKGKEGEDKEKEGESEEEKEEGGSDEEEYSDDGDYNQNIDFDDDEDDYNMDDGGDDEAIY